MRRLRLPQFRFTLRTFLIVCMVPAPLLAWLASVKVEAVRQRAAIARLESRGILDVFSTPPRDSFETDLVRQFVDHDAFNTAVRATCFDGSFLIPVRNDTKIDSDDILALTQLKGLRELDLIRDHDQSFRGITSDLQLAIADWDRIAAIQTLTSLSVDSELDANVLVKLTKLPELRFLCIPATQVSDEMMQRLGAHPSFSGLECDARLISRNGLTQLAKSPVLRTLSLRNLRDEKDIIEGLSGSDSLNHLVLWYARLRVSDAEIINRCSARHLILINCDIDRGFFMKLQDSRSLEYLHATKADRDDKTMDRMTLAILTRYDDHFTIGSPHSAKSSLNSKTSNSQPVP